MCPCRFRASPRSSRRSCQNGRGTRFIPTAPRERRINTSVHVLDRCKRPCTHACHVYRRVSAHIHTYARTYKRFSACQVRMRDMGMERENRARVRPTTDFCPRKLVSLVTFIYRDAITIVERPPVWTHCLFHEAKASRSETRSNNGLHDGEKREWRSVGWSTISVWTIFHTAISRILFMWILFSLIEQLS